MAKIIVSHPTGNANVRAAVKGMANSNILGKFYTSIASFPRTILSFLGKIGPLAELNKRTFDPQLKAHTKMWPWYELGRLLSSKAGLKKLTRHEEGVFSIDGVYRNFDEYVAGILKAQARKGITAIYAYEDGARLSFKQARNLKLQCLYDLPIGYWRSARKLLYSEREARPDWASTLTGFMDSDQKLSFKDEELASADHIFVASTFTKQTLKEYPGKLVPVSVIPYGFPEVAANRVYEPVSGRKIKLLFVGGLSQRKGIASLIEAVEALSNQFELTIVGHKMADDCVPLNEALKKHRWIPALAHAEVLNLMQQHDIFVFPSLFEGFGLVITEAMSQGTPVITTERTVGPDIIKHGENGWLIEAGLTTALVDVLKVIAARPQLIEQVGKAAMQTAMKRPWSVYGHELSTKIQEVSSH